MLENIPSLVRSAGTNLSPNELLAQALDVLQGVSADAASALESIDIRTIFDLGASSIFFTAMRITEAAQADTEFARVGKLPADIVDDTSVALIDIPNRDIVFLKALDENKANNLKSALFVTTIRDLALWPPYHAAVRIVNEVYGNVSGPTDDPEMPQELVPRMGKLPTERVQYEVVVFDQVMDDSIIPQLGSGSTGTPSTPGGGGLIVVDPNDRDRPYDYIDIPGGSNIYPLRSSIPSAGESRPYVPSLTEEIRSISERTNLAPLSAPTVSSAPSATSYTPIEQAGQLDLSKLSQAIGFTKPALGAVVTMTQSWYTHGLSLGQLLHTIALGPGESTRIAMIDWARKSKGEGKQSILESEDLDSTLSRSRAISEVTNSVARESQQGFSESKNEGFSIGASHSGSVTGSWGAIGFSAGHTIATQYSTGYASSSAFSSGERSLSASMTQNVLDSTHQASNLARNRRATMVQEVSQEESEKISTRALTNYNHMHALSIQYYEIVQLYKVVVEVSRITACLFIPIKHLTFTDPTVLRKFRNQLVAAALEPAIRMLSRGEPDTATFHVPHLSEAWDNPNKRWLLDLVRGQMNYEPLTSDPKTIRLLLRQYPTKIRFSARIRNKPGVAPPPISPGLFEQLVVVFNDGTKAEIPFTSGSVGDFDLSAWSATNLSDNRVVSRFWQAKAIYVVMKADAWTTDLERTVGVSIAFRQSPDWVAKYGQNENSDPEAFDYSFRINILEADRGDLPDERKQSIAVAEIEAFPTTHQILDHLEDNAMYYSQAIWRSLDPTSLSLLLSEYSFAGQPITEMIDATPVSAIGNYLAFRFYGAEKTSWWKNFVEKKGANLTERKEDLVPMPSGGVFAEAVLGRFNSAEKLDLTRFWDWQDSPIPITAPEISAIAAGGRAQQDGIKIDLGDLKPATLNLTVPPAIPDPTGMTASLNAIANGNMFRDMSGLAANIAAAQAAMQTNAAGAQKFAELANEAAKISANLMGAKLNAAEKLDKENEDKGKQAEGQNNREKVLNPESNGTSGGETGGSGKIGRPQEYSPDPDEEWESFPPKSTTPKASEPKPKAHPAKPTAAIIRDVEIRLKIWVPSEVWEPYPGPVPTNWFDLIRSILYPQIKSAEALLLIPSFSGNNREVGEPGSSMVDIRVPLKIDTRDLEPTLDKQNVGVTFGVAKMYLGYQVEGVEGDHPGWYKRLKDSAEASIIPPRSLRESDADFSVDTIFENNSKAQVLIRLQASPFFPWSASNLPPVNVPFPGLDNKVDEWIRWLGTQILEPINALLTITFQKRRDGELEYLISGEHDGFPFYELYVNGASAYHYGPSNDDHFAPGKLKTEFHRYGNVDAKGGPFPLNKKPS